MTTTVSPGITLDAGLYEVRCACGRLVATTISERSAHAGQAQHDEVCAYGKSARAAREKAKGELRAKRRG